MKRLVKITFGELREMGVRGVLIYCSDHKSTHWIAISADRWPDYVTWSDDDKFTCKSCGKKDADIRPDFNWNKRAA